MKRTKTILTLTIALIWAVTALATEPGKGTSKPVSINDFVVASGKTDISLDAFDNLIQRLEKKSISNQREFVRFIFAKTHSQILKHYRNHAEFQELFEDGTYNCLTGTILYSLIFDHFGIRYNIIETNYHIFMMVSTEQGDVMIEVTDPIQGFVYNQDEIDSRIQSYKDDWNASQAPKESYQFKFNLYNTVSQAELLGLLYYNLAVESYNKQQLGIAIDYLLKSSEYYNSVRINEFSGILLYAVSQSNSDEQTKLQQIIALRSIRNKTAQTLAGI